MEHVLSCHSLFTCSAGYNTNKSTGFLCIVGGQQVSTQAYRKHLWRISFFLGLYVQSVMMQFVLCGLRPNISSLRSHRTTWSKIFSSHLFGVESTPWLEGVVFTVFSIGIQHIYLQLDFQESVDQLVLHELTETYSQMHSNSTMFSFTLAYPVVEINFRCLKAWPSKPPQCSSMNWQHLQEKFMTICILEWKYGCKHSHTVTYMSMTGLWINLLFLSGTCCRSLLGNKFFASAFFGILHIITTFHLEFTLT